MASPTFRTKFDPEHGSAVEIADGIQRITAPNESAFTYRGTNTYILGTDTVAVIDPGPALEDHFDLLMETLKGRTVSHIVVTHTHMDHSPLAAQLKDKTGAPIFAEGPHRNSRELHLGETNSLDAAADRDFKADVILQHGDVIEGKDWALETILTPGHTQNHACFAIKDTNMLFSGDHVMSWSTSIVAPPDGSMADYMNSLSVMMERTETVYFPGHGGRLEKAPEFVRALRAHRKMRETAVLSRIRAGDRTIPEIVKVIYKDTDPRLHGAAGLSVFAHIEDLVIQNKIQCDGPPALNSRYLPVDA